MEESDSITKNLNNEIIKFFETYKHEKTEARLMFNVEKEEDIVAIVRKRFLILNGCIGEKNSSDNTKLEMHTKAENEEINEFKEVLAILVRLVMENFHLKLTKKEMEKIKPGKNYLFYIVRNLKELKILLAISGFGKDGKQGSSEHYKLTQKALDELFQANILDLKGHKVTESKFIPFSRKKEKYICISESHFREHSKNIKSRKFFLIKMTLIFKLLQGSMILDIHGLQTVLRLPQNSAACFQDINATRRAFEKLREKSDKSKAEYLTYYILATYDERFSSIVNYDERKAPYRDFSENLDFLVEQSCRIHFHCEDESFESTEHLWDSLEVRVYRKLLLKLWDRFSNVDIFEFCQYLSQCSEDNLITELCINQKYWKDEGTHYVFSIEKLEKYESIIKIRPPCMFCMLYFPLEYGLDAFYEHGLACMPFNIKNMAAKYENFNTPFEKLSFLLRYERAIKLNSYLESKDVFHEIVKKRLREKFIKSKLLSLLDDVIRRDDRTLLELLEKRMQEHGIPLKPQNAILKAAKYGCSAIVEYLIKKTDEDFKKNVNGQTAMHHLVRRGDLELLKIIKNNYKRNIVKEIFLCDKAGQSPVVYAAALTNIKVFEFLQETVNNKEAFYNHIEKNNVMFYPIRMSCLSMLELIWEFNKKRINADCKLWTNKMDGYTLLGKAAQKGNYEIIKFLIDKICSLKTISKETMELELAKSLIIAIVEGCTEVVDVLMKTLKKKAPKNMKKVYEWRSSTGESALHYLTFLRNKSLLENFMEHKNLTTDKIKEICCKSLSKKGRVSDIDYDTPFTCSYSNFDFQEEKNANPTPLHYAMMTENKTVVECLVKIHKFDVNARSSFGDTPLHTAAVSGHIGNVSALLKEINSNIGDFINAKNDKGNTPLHVAAQYGSLEVLKFLIEKGADVNALNERGYTPLHYSVLTEHFEVIEHLLNNGAKHDLENLKGCSPLRLAISYDDDDIKKLFDDKMRKIQPEKQVKDDCLL